METHMLMNVADENRYPGGILVSIKIPNCTPFSVSTPEARCTSGLRQLQHLERGFTKARCTPSTCGSFTFRDIQTAAECLRLLAMLSLETHTFRRLHYARSRHSEGLSVFGRVELVYGCGRSRAARSPWEFS